ncbi:MAG: helix-turn-helix domain-containing protein [Lachnospiraceae bacterium]|nr:helix-turn-helix domain-containing protein [Lachnospiraceae bacterium]
MTCKNKDRLHEMLKMRLDGCTFQEIADKYGVSRQYVQQSIADFTGKKRGVKKSSLDKCIYPNIRKWMIDNNISMVKLSKICGLSKSCIDPIRMKLRGDRDFKISEIKAMLKESGGTFEYMFSTEGEENEKKANQSRKKESI